MPQNQAKNSEQSTRTRDDAKRKSERGSKGEALEQKTAAKGDGRGGEGGEEGFGEI